MSSLTNVLLSALSADLKDHFDEYQFEQLLNGDSQIWPDANVSQIRSHALFRKILSKDEGDGRISEVASLAALNKFVAANERCRNWELHLSDSLDELLWGELKSELYNFFHVDGLPILASNGDWVNRGGVGPGASIKARGQDFYTKVFDSPLTATKDGLLDIWENSVCKDDRWLNALLCTYQHHIPTIVEGNKLCFVPKNTKTARSICTEPTINMWLQLGIGSLINNRSKDVYNINLSKQQDVNRDMAFQASNGADFCTIDLESASDSISQSFLRAILPRDAYSALDFTRSPLTSLPDGSKVVLHMASTQGNGFTFPLETAIFSAIVSSVYRVMGIPLIKRGSLVKNRNFSVFGDDIICTKEAYRLVVRLLNICGFTVNMTKSFSQGLFYESCGGDYFAGQNVRPFYIKGLQTQEDFYKAINGLNRWSAINGISVPLAVSVLIRKLPRTKYFVPCYEADDAGIQVPLDKVPSHCIRNYSSIGHVKYNLRVPKPSFFVIDSDNDRVRCGDHKKRDYNPYGAWIAFLHGSVRGGRVTVRQTDVSYMTKRKITPNWDVLSPLLSGLGVQWSDWSSRSNENYILII